MKKFMIVAALLLVAACSDNSDQVQGEAAVSAAVYGASANAGLTGCAGHDRDGDGFVACDMADKTTGKPFQILCGYADHPGCKAGQ